MNISDMDFAASFFSDHESGRITDEEFLQEIKKLLAGETSDEAVTMPGMRCSCVFLRNESTLLKGIKNRYRLFLYQ